MGTLQGEQVEFNSGAGMYLNNLIHFGLRLRHVSNVQGYFDDLLGDARQRTRYPWMEVHYRLELEYEQCMWTQQPKICCIQNCQKKCVNTVGILKY